MRNRMRLYCLTVVFATIAIMPRLSIAEIPVGTILAFYGNENQLPDGYLLCNGSEITRTKYPVLYEHLIAANSDLHIAGETVRLPDLRAEFLRGVDSGRDVDRGRTLGSEQPPQAALPRHDHGLSQRIGISAGWPGGWGSVGNQRAVNGPGDGPMSVQHKAIDRETRPRNVAVNFIIRAQ